MIYQLTVVRSSLERTLENLYGGLLNFALPKKNLKQQQQQPQPQQQTVRIHQFHKNIKASNQAGAFWTFRPQLFEVPQVCQC